MMSKVMCGLRTCYTDFVMFHYIRIFYGNNGLLTNNVEVSGAFYELTIKSRCVVSSQVDSTCEVSTIKIIC